MRIKIMFLAILVVMAIVLSSCTSKTEQVTMPKPGIQIKQFKVSEQDITHKQLNMEEMNDFLSNQNIDIIEIRQERHWDNQYFTIYYKYKSSESVK